MTIQYDRLENPFEPDDPIECPFCGGTGTDAVMIDENMDCLMCHGAGLVERYCLTKSEEYHE